MIKKQFPSKSSKSSSRTAVQSYSLRPLTLVSLASFALFCVIGLKDKPEEISWSPSYPLQFINAIEDTAYGVLSKHLPIFPALPLSEGVSGSAVMPVMPVPSELKSVGTPLNETTGTALLQEEGINLNQQDEPVLALPFERDFRLERGQTLTTLLFEAGASVPDVQEITKALLGEFSLRRLKSGASVQVVFDAVTPEQRSTVTNDEDLALSLVHIEFEAGRNIDVTRQADGTYKATENLLKVNVQEKVVTGKIGSSLYLTAKKQGIPSSVLAEFVKLYSYTVDFQRDINASDTFEIGFQSYTDENGKRISGGGLTYAMLSVDGQEKRFYRFTASDGAIDWYDQNGKSNKRLLMKTPIEGARLTSGFGSRRHPVLGYTRMHKGIDFAAPIGTPILASGTGTIAFVGQKRGYGNVIEIKHGGGSLSTLYAHMKGFARGMRVGQTISQGAVIGYVGMTGITTGPHLHYEVHQNGSAINPLGKNLPVETVMSYAEKIRFKDFVAMVEKQRKGYVKQEVLANINAINKD